ncbi:MAG: hypothetical protein ACU84Q_16995 [Gammaproteobacteria bacterium]
MNWEAIAAINEAIGAAGVIITLAYLAIQLRSHNQALRIQNMQERASASSKVFALQATAETMESAIAKAWATGEELSVTEHHAIESYISMFLLSAECDLRVFQEGLMPIEDWTPIRNQIKLLFYATPAKTWWTDITRQIVTKSFALEVDSVITEIDAQPNPSARTENSASNKAIEAVEDGSSLR